jgi:diguanylate cyclase (GGDEF)-like protein/PAS domain S-box-containing protein
VSERSRRELLEQMEKAVETMQLGVTITDLDGRILYVNPADAELHGWEREELIGQNARVFSPPERWANMTVALARSATRWNRERPNLKKDGSVFLAKLLSDVVFDSSRSPVGIITTCEDITERKKVEEAVASHAERLEALVTAQHALAAAELDPASLVPLALETVRSLTGAEHAALTLPEGDRFVVHAWSGLAEPPQAAAIHPAGSLASLATTRRAVIVNPDASSAPAVDREVVRALDARSLAVVPLLHAGRLTAVLDLFSPRPDAFGEAERTVLELMAGSLAASVDHSLEAASRVALLADRTARLAVSEARFADVFRTSAAGMALVDVHGVFLSANESFARSVGSSEPDLAGTSYLARVHPEDRETEGALLASLASGPGRGAQAEMRLLGQEGTVVWVLRSAGILDGFAEEPAAIILQTQDVTDRRRAQDALLHDALHDALTGLSNRTLFLDRLGLALQRAARQRLRFAVLFIDIDRFKVINDSMGHLAGDQLLSSVARRLASAVRPGDTVARLGGDEFAILLDGLASVEEATATAEYVLELLGPPFVLGGREVFVTASVGVAPNPEGPIRADEMLRDADTAMYHAKASGRARVALFDREMRERVLERLAIETEIRQALERGEFDVYYQPIREIASGLLHGVEALVRWRHPGKGLVYPGAFLAVAEETGLIVPLGAWVLEEAGRTVARWHRLWPRTSPVSLSVNLSARQFASEGLEEQVRATLSRTGLPPSSLTLEVTETTIIENPEAARALLSRLREIGVKISIDDFGTGYSSLSYLHWLPLDRLKIDRSFVAGLGPDRRNYEILRTIAILAKNLGLDVVAEGVETADQLATLSEIGCDCAQGFLFAPALRSSRVEELLAGGG